MQIFDDNIGYWEKRQFFAENLQKSQKIVIIKSTPERFQKNDQNCATEFRQNWGPRHFEILDIFNFVGVRFLTDSTHTKTLWANQTSP
jgi:hypothetical protein